MKKIIWTYGLIAALFLGSIFFIFHFAFDAEVDSKYAEIFGFGGMLIGLSTVVLGVRAMAKESKPDPFPFKKAFLIGLAIVSLGSLGYALGWLLYYNTIGDNGMMEAFFQKEADGILNSTMPEEEKMAVLAEKENFKNLYLNNPLVMFGFTLLEIFPIGLIVALISAFVFKRK